MQNVKLCFAAESRAEEAWEHQKAAKAAGKRAKKQRLKANKQEQAQAALQLQLPPLGQVLHVCNQMPPSKDPVTCLLQPELIVLLLLPVHHHPPSTAVTTNRFPVRQTNGQAKNQAAASGLVPAGPPTLQQIAQFLTHALPGALALLQLSSESISSQTTAAPVPSLFHCPLTKVCVAQGFASVMCLGTTANTLASHSQQVYCLLSVSFNVLHPCFTLSSVMCNGTDACCLLSLPASACLGAHFALRLLHAGPSHPCRWAHL